MDRLEIYEYLKKLNIWYEITEHDAVYNMLQITNIELPYPEAEGKNLFFLFDKKQNYYLITVKGNKKVNLKEFRKNNNTRPLSFASEDDMMSIIGLPSGSVTPLGVLNDKENNVKVFIDEEFITSSGLIGVHPNDNRATVWLKVEDLIDIIKKSGNTVNIVKI